MTARPDTPASGIEAALVELEALLGDRLSTSAGVTRQYASGESFPAAYPPDGVAFPTSTEEVSQIAAICHRHRMPMVPSGAGTSLEGHIAAPFGGLAINFARMNRILHVDGADLDCTVEPGVTREQLNIHLRDSGLFFPIDPGADASIGGMASTRASGTNAVRYGTMAHNVLGLTVVQPDCTVIRTGGRARKSSAGYDLTRLYVGSEGTLGIITEVKLRLYGIPESILSATCSFDTLEGAVDTVMQTIQMGIPVARVEFMDETQVRACNAFSALGLPEKPHLFFEFHGSPAGTEDQAGTVAALVQENGGSPLAWATSTEDRNRLWKARHDAYHANRAIRPNATLWPSDIAVPISELPASVLAVRADIERNGLCAPIVGHVGDGNYHVSFMIDPDDADEKRRAEEVYSRMIRAALAVGGTCTGEHGIGMMKQAYLVEETGAEAVATMRAVKQALDPLNLMNPGKIFA
ncbi:FAD-binding oxidoreductase [Croceicoccus sediminis]|uniref:FAD-binding oxidoreductase n=1 Tax=Croceicoccus sediminis TaxID=2571150 RepID=UPI0011838A36|nr:FAD-linked oxidase C-terminal domain-containing protein [Croceicoccus sediminis]